MSIELVRIDDRLIHGQVVTGWVNELGVEQIIIVNDKVAEDQIQKSVLTMTAPAGIKLHIFGIEKFNSISQKNPINRKTLLLFSNPIDVLAVYQNGIKFPAVNIGGIRYNDERKHRLSKAVAVTDAEKEAINSLVSAGVEVFIQMVPKEKKEVIK